MSAADASPEVRIQNIVKRHRDRKDAIRAENEKQMKALAVVMPRVNKDLVASVNQDVLEIFTNQHLLDAEAKELHHQADKFKKISQDWFSLFDKFNHTLKELGDMSNWATIIESDARDTVRALDEMTRAQKSLRALEGA
eukprot:Rhum_TRINITY_DN22823_c0_g1::Rhum_TRINITY_DN22823_c0_g1_i1::g.176164::m.176164/K20185/BLOC1S1; biogenesis of lysosome-related organelles complex 1 subunit 1